MLELMRLLADVEGLEEAHAWALTKASRAGSVLIMHSHQTAGTGIRQHLKSAFENMSLIVLGCRPAGSDPSCGFAARIFGNTYFTDRSRIAVQEQSVCAASGPDTVWATPSRKTASAEATCSYTSHAMMPESIETWQVDMFGRMLPRTPCAPARACARATSSASGQLGPSSVVVSPATCAHTQTYIQSAGVRLIEIEISTITVSSMRCPCAPR